MIGERLKQIRVARGYSLEELAAHMDGLVTKQSISKYEKGKSQPSVTVLARLSAALGVKTADLYREPIVQVIAYRRRSRLGKRLCAEIEATASRELEERIRLQKLCYGDQPFALGIQSREVRSLQDAEDAAEWLRGQWNLGEAPISNLTDTLEDQHIHVIEVDADEKFDGLSLSAAEDGATVGAGVVTRDGVPGERQRLNLAHELGHLVLKASKEIDDEKAAFRFAGAFLAPRDMLLREIGQPTRNNIDMHELLLLKKRFGMSIQALIRRLRELDVIAENLYREWCIDINKQGLRKNEPEPLEREKGQWLARTVYNAVAEGWMKNEEGERLLGVSIDIPEPKSLTERRAFLRLPLEERRRIMEESVDALARVYETDTEWQEFQGGDLVDYKD